MGEQTSYHIYNMRLNTHPDGSLQEQRGTASGARGAPKPV